MLLTTVYLSSSKRLVDLLTYHLILVVLPTKNLAFWIELFFPVSLVYATIQLNIFLRSPSFVNRFPLIIVPNRDWKSFIIFITSRKKKSHILLFHLYELKSNFNGFAWISLLWPRVPSSVIVCCYIPCQTSVSLSSAYFFAWYDFYNKICFCGLRDTVEYLTF